MRARRWWEGARARWERWQIARVRAAYRSGAKVESAEGPGFAAMVEEMRRGLAVSSVDARARADTAVLRAIFFGPLGPALLAAAARSWPALTASVLTRTSPLFLRFLVGPVAVAASSVNRVPHCAFRAEGGERLCQEVCRVPTESFTAQGGYAVRLQPDAHGPGCTWTWGDAP